MHIGPRRIAVSKHLIAGLTLTMAPVAAPAMTVAEFLTKAEALKARGMGAMFSPDLKVVVGEVRTVATAYRAELVAGRADIGCPPPKGRVRLSPTQFLNEFKAVPVAHPSATSVKSVYFAMMKKRYPCR